MAGEIEENVGIRASVEFFRRRGAWGVLISEDAYEVLNSDVASSIIYLNVIGVEVAVGGRTGGWVEEDGAWAGISGVTGVSVCKHEDDVGVWDAVVFEGLVDGEGVGGVAVVEPVARGAEDDGMVGGGGCGSGRDDCDLTVHR